jgi:hypothetical protein
MMQYLFSFLFISEKLTELAHCQTFSVFQNLRFWYKFAKSISFNLYFGKFQIIYQNEDKNKICILVSKSCMFKQVTLKFLLEEQSTNFLSIMELIRNALGIAFQLPLKCYLCY